jgi:hypothetical protein
MDAHWKKRDGERLSPEEDGALRRLHWFEQLGCDLSSAVKTLKDGLRGRDRRTDIRDPFATPEESEKKRNEGVSSSYWAAPKQ